MFPVLCVKDVCGLQRENHSPLEGESQKPSRQGNADAVGGNYSLPWDGAEGSMRALTCGVFLETIRSGRPEWLECRLESKFVTIKGVNRP